MSHTRHPWRFTGSAVKALAVWTAIAGLTAVVGCRRGDPTISAFRITTQWSGALELDQLEFNLQDVDGESVVSGKRRPEMAEGPLESPTAVAVYVPDGLTGHVVLCDVRGYAQDRLRATGQASAVVLGHQIAEVTVTLIESSPPGDPGVIRGDPCTANAQCRSGKCIDGVCCDTECTGVCVSCALPGKKGMCTPVPVGVKHQGCADQTAAPCANDGTCDGAGACRKSPVGSRCAPGTCEGSTITASAACDGSGKCVPGPAIICAPFNCATAAGQAPQCLGRCTTSAECVPGRECENGSCGKKFEGAGCTNSGECASSFCVDGVCCESECTGTCVSCDQAGFSGSCRPTPEGNKDRRDLCKDQSATSCGTTGVCDGKGACARYPAGAVCQPPVCASSTILRTAGKCDGAGKCLPGSQLACDPYACSGAACNAACARNDECSVGRICEIAQHSCGKKGLGQACQGAGQCETGFCVDGVCCDGACGGACRTCSNGLVPGTCAVVPAGGADPRKMCQDQGATSCGNDGFCNGAGACRKYAVGSVCSPGSCSAANNMRTFVGTCDSTGKCAAGATVACAPYVCNGAICYNSCATAANCQTPNTCIAGACGLLGSGAPCTSPSQCAAPLSCIGTICQLRPLGNACTAAGQCGSGSCTNGVCCQAADCGKCRACNVTGFLGTCHALPAGTPDPKGMCPQRAKTTCGADGTCDGGGNCRNWQAGTECEPASCNGRDRNNPKTCDGAGMCETNGISNCSPYDCNPSTSACYSSCDSASQCCCNKKCRNNACN